MSTQLCLTDSGWRRSKLHRCDRLGKQTANDMEGSVARGWRPWVWNQTAQPGREPGSGSGGRGGQGGSDWAGTSTFIQIISLLWYLLCCVILQTDQKIISSSNPMLIYYFTGRRSRWWICWTIAHRFQWWFWCHSLSKSKHWSVCSGRYEFIKSDDDEEIDNHQFCFCVLLSDRYVWPHVPCPYPQLQEAVRRVTLAQKAVPVLCGSSLKNKGVQPLLDAITAYLPAPDERHNDLVWVHPSLPSFDKPQLKLALWTFFMSSYTLVA